MPANKSYTAVPKDKQFLNQKSLPTNTPYRIRFLGEYVSGYELWIENGKTKDDGSKQYAPKRVLDIKDYTAEDYAAAQPDERGGRREPTEFRAAAVYDYQTQNIKVFQYTAKTIHNTLDAHEQMEDYLNDYREWDVSIKKTGQGKENTKYEVICHPPKKLDPTIEVLWKEAESSIDLGSLFEGKYPMPTPDPTEGVFD